MDRCIPVAQDTFHEREEVFISVPGEARGGTSRQLPQKLHAEALCNLVELPFLEKGPQLTVISFKTV